MKLSFLENNLKIIIITKYYYIIDFKKSAGEQNVTHNITKISENI